MHRLSPAHAALLCSRRLTRPWTDPMIQLSRRPVFFGAVLVAVVFLAVSPAAAQQGWPEYPLPGEHAIDRGPGQYFSWIKLGLLYGLFLLWVAIVDWVSRDTQEFRLPHAVWNPVTFGPFFVALFLAGLTIPLFPLGFALTALALFIPALTYVINRNGQLEYHEKVLTPAHIRYLIAQQGKKMGFKIASEKKAAHEKGAQVTFQVLGGRDEQANQAMLVASRQSDGFLSAKQAIANGIDHRAEKIMLDFGAEEVKSRYQVDGVWHDSDGYDREEGDQILAVFKRLAAAKPDERRARQQGKFIASYEKKKLMCSLISQGTKTGERAIVSLQSQKKSFETLQDLGMREDMVKEFKGYMLREKGIVLLSGMSAGGVSTTLGVSLSSTDRLLRDFVSLEDVSDKLPEIENVDPVYYDKRKGQTPAMILDPVMRKQPDVLVFPEIPDSESANAAVDAAQRDFLVFSTVKAKEAVESLLRVLLMKVPAKNFAPRIICVLNQRLIRKLCESCKEAYEPSPALLKKLNLPAGRVEQLYRHPEEAEKPCPDCHGIGYRGRTAIFELLEVDDTMREVLIKQPKLDILRKAARKAKHHSLQHEGILTVIKGTTSVDELMRVLRQ